MADGFDVDDVDVNVAPFCRFSSIGRDVVVDDVLLVTPVTGRVSSLLLES